MSSFSEKFKNFPRPGKKRTEPLWKGPIEDGITFSMLSRFLVCRERFRITVIEGLRPANDFNHRIEYGQMWHVCEEAYASKTLGWKDQLYAYAKTLSQKYPMQQDQIRKWTMICAIQFPEYIEFWKKHRDTERRVPLAQEKVFDLPYSLPSGRTVRLRGKWDSVDRIGNGIWLQENKTKGDIDPLQLKRQLTFDLQSMLYLLVLSRATDVEPIEKAKMECVKKGTLAERSIKAIAGVRYNVVRRPLSGGKGSIKQKQGETEAQYYGRLAEYIVNEPETYFMRWNVPVTPNDIDTFRKQCLDPLLEQVCDWYDWIGTLNQDPFDTKGSGGIHWRHPFGVFNIMDEGGSSDLDEYLATGSEVGLHRVDKLFTELEEG